MYIDITKFKDLLALPSKETNFLEAVVEDHTILEITDQPGHTISKDITTTKSKTKAEEVMSNKEEASTKEVLEEEAKDNTVEAKREETTSDKDFQRTQKRLTISLTSS